MTTRATSPSRNGEASTRPWRPSWTCSSRRRCGAISANCASSWCSVRASSDRGGELRSGGAHGPSRAGVGSDSKACDERFRPRVVVQQGRQCSGSRPRSQPTPRSSSEPVVSPAASSRQEHRLPLPHVGHRCGWRSIAVRAGPWIRRDRVALRLGGRLGEPSRIGSGPGRGRAELSRLFRHASGRDHPTPPCSRYPDPQ